VTTSALGLAAPVEVTFDVVCDAALYPEWLVGAHRIREVDDDWPMPGSSFHHSLGVGPLTLVRDRTTVLEVHPPHALVLLARIGPLGSARVRFTVTPTETGSHLAIEEVPASGVLRALWNPLTRPAVGLGLWGRNEVSLQALRAIVEERARA
jgi:uncharacterized protein YndB with AHSA1/START domain